MEPFDDERKRKNPFDFLSDEEFERIFEIDFFCGINPFNAFLIINNLSYIIYRAL